MFTSRLLEEYPLNNLNVINENETNKSKLKFVVNTDTVFFHVTF